MAIIINDKGLTDNGYHRLAACIQAGVPFQTNQRSVRFPYFKTWQ